MCTLACRDQVLGIKNIVIALNKVIGFHRIHVMDDRTVKNFIPRNAQVQTLVSSYDKVPNTAPLTRSVEGLVDIAVVPEGALAYLPSKFQVLESFFE